ncbi:MAG: hypothetical protein RIR39_1538 [Pseudomonadota bacterium]|jgi:hypothetical protein
MNSEQKKLAASLSKIDSVLGLFTFALLIALGIYKLMLLIGA